MKRTLLALSIAVLLFSCGSSSGPESAAKNFMENLSQGKVKEAKKYATEATGQLLDMAAAMGTMKANPDYKFVMEKDSVVDNKAWVTINNLQGETETVELIKVDGEWLVNIEAKK